MEENCLKPLVRKRQAMVVGLSVINHSVQPVGEPIVTKRKRYRESEFTKSHANRGYPNQERRVKGGMKKRLWLLSLKILHGYGVLVVVREG